MGCNDFAAFCRRREGATTIRDLQRLDWSREGDLITAHVTADAFCWSMVRSLVGALLAVGEPAQPRLGARGCSPRRSGRANSPAAPARGLTLVGVDYPPDDQLGSRVMVTRELRRLEARREIDVMARSNSDFLAELSVWAVLKPPATKSAA